MSGRLRVLVADDHEAVRQGLRWMLRDDDAGREAREEATDRMLKQAASIGANGVLNVRYATTAVTMGAAEILAYGTAVVLE